jgi:hypothetical protein
LGAYPGEFTHGAIMGMPPYRGFSISDDGRSLLTSMLRVKSDVWLLQAQADSRP